METRLAYIDLNRQSVIAHSDYVIVIGHVYFTYPIMPSGNNTHSSTNHCVTLSALIFSLYYERNAVNKP